MDITLTKSNWDEVTKTLYEFFVPEDDMVITEDHEYVTPFIAVPFNDPLNHRFLILGCGEASNKIELTEGTRVEYDESSITLIEEDIEIFKKPLSPRLLKERDTKRTSILRDLVHLWRLSGKAETLNTAIGESMFEIVEDPQEYNIMEASIPFFVDEVLNGTGLSLREGVHICVWISIRYPRTPNRKECIHFPLSFAAVFTENDNSGLFKHRTVQYTQNYTDLITMISRYLS